ncbi:MAG: TolC family protein [Verrucomicrobia bacterium]|nr:TolC family protein [Verrucomicrobiota bacterium]
MTPLEPPHCEDEPLQSSDIPLALKSFRSPPSVAPPQSFQGTVISFLFVVLLSAPLFTSCSSPQKRKNVQLDFETPGTWSSAGVSAEPVVDDWWSNLGSSNLSEVVIEALNRNHDLEIAAARLAAAEAEARIAGAELMPSLGLGFDANRSQRNFIGFPIPGSDRNILTTRSTSYGVALNSSWELDLWGRVRSGKRAAAADVQASEFELRGARQSIAAQAVKAWLAVAESSQQMRLATQTAQSHQATVNQIRERYRRGLRSSLDFRLAETALSSAQAALAERERLLDRATRQFQILLGRYPSGTTQQEDLFPEVISSVPAGLPSDLLNRRPDLVAAEQRLAAADARLFQAKASLLPRISLTASGGTSTADLADLISSDFGVWALAGNLSQPLLQGGRLRAGVNLAVARTRQALANYRKTALTAFAEVETALAAENYLSNREKTLVSATNQAQAALRLSHERYTAGVEPFLVVLESERRAFEAEGLLIAVRRQRIENRVELHVALGGGFHPAPGASNSETKSTSGTEPPL